MNIIKSLFEAVKNNEVEIIKGLIAQKGIKQYINAALVKASELGNLEVIRYLVEEAPINMRADIHTEDNRAFSWSVNYKKWEVAQYFISKGIPEDFDNNALYKEMFNNEESYDNTLFIQLKNNLKKKIINSKDNDLDKYELEFLKTQDVEMKHLIEETKRQRLEVLKDPQVIKKALITAINNKSYNIIKDCLNKIQINEEILNSLIKLENNEINDIILSKLEFDNNDEILSILNLDKGRHYASYSNNTDYVFKFLERYKNKLITQNDHTIFDNYPDFKDMEGYFSKISCLERYYTVRKSHIKYNIDVL